MELESVIKDFEKRKNSLTPLELQILSWIKELKLYRESENEYIDDEDKERCKKIRKLFDKFLEQGITLFVLKKNARVRGDIWKIGTVLELIEDYNDTAPLFKIIGTEDYAYIDIGCLEPVNLDVVV